MAGIPDYIRGRLYLLFPAIAALVSGYGLMEAEKAELWLALAAALLGGGNLLAAAYTPQRKAAPPTPPPPPEPRSDALTQPPTLYAPSIPAALLALAKDLADGETSAVVRLPDGRPVTIGVSIHEMFRPRPS